MRKGQLLIELDPTVAGAEAAQASRGLLSARVAEARNDAFLAHLAGRPAVSSFTTAGVSTSIGVEAHAVLAAARNAPMSTFLIEPCARNRVTGS